MKPLYILKIGGSIATYKNREALAIRRSLLRKIALQIRKAGSKGDFDLILIHGSGAAGHRLAKRFSLHEGVKNDAKKWQASFESQIANQKLDNAIAEIFISQGLRVTPCHTASVVLQKNKRLHRFDTASIDAALENGCIPLLYGEMVFDTDLGMSVCSGDTLAASLSRTHRARKILFASDIDGVFTADPHIRPEAELLERLSLSDVEKRSTLSASHNTDVTGGLLGKIRALYSASSDAGLETIEIFNGFSEGNYAKALLGIPFPHTTIFTKKQRDSVL